MRETTQASDGRALLRTTSDHTNGSPGLGIEVVHVSVCNRRSGDRWGNRNRIRMGNMRDGLHVYDIFGCNIVGSAPFSAIDLPDLTNTIACSISCAGVG
jgi:hypothetical protein